MGREPPKNIEPALLEYVSRSPSSVLREKAAHSARGNGFFCMVFGIFSAFVFSGFADQRGPLNFAQIILTLLVVLYVLPFFVCGPLYFIASIKIKTANPRWENILIYTSLVHLLLLTLILMFVMCIAWLRGKITAPLSLMMLLNFALVMSLGTTFQLVRKAR